MDSFWNVANALKDAVKQQTAEITASLQNTDWKSELSEFQEGLQEETAEISHKAKEVTEELGQKTLHAAKNLPQVVGEGRRLAAVQLEHLPTSTSTRAKEAAAQLQQASASLTKMGRRVVTNTSEIIDHFSSAIQAEMNAAQETGRATSGKMLGRGPKAGEASKFSRFDADVASMQRDSSTYCDEPEDVEDFEAWAKTFDLPGRKPDISKLLNENTFMSELQARIVPVVVDYESFWTRYFYRLHKLEERHAKVAALTSRAEAAVLGEDEVGWDTDDEDDVVDEASVAVKHVESVEAAGEGQEGKKAVEDGSKDEEDAGAAAEDSNFRGSKENEVLEELDKGKAEAAGGGEEAEATAANEKKLVKKEKDGGTLTADKKESTAALDRTKVEDDVSSLDLSGAEDYGEDGGDDSDWGDVAEWE